MIAKAFCNEFINVFIHFLKMGGVKKNEMFLHPCICPLVYMTISASVYPCISMSVYQCVRVSVSLCINVSMHQCVRVSVCPCISVSLYQCFRVSMCPCISVSLYQGIRGSLCPCIPVYVHCCCCLPTPFDPCLWGESDHPAFGPLTGVSLHLGSSSITPAGSVHKSRGDNAVRMWVPLKRSCLWVL